MFEESMYLLPFPPAPSATSAKENEAQLEISSFLDSFEVGNQSKTSFHSIFHNRCLVCSDGPLLSGKYQTSQCVSNTVPRLPNILSEVISMEYTIYTLHVFQVFTNQSLVGLNFLQLCSKWVASNHQAILQYNYFAFTHFRLTLPLTLFRHSIPFGCCVCNSN